MKIIFLSVTLLFVFSLNTQTSFAQDGKNKVNPKAGANREPASMNSGKKAIEFEDAVVEGVKSQPLDSLNLLSRHTQDGVSPHLYKKRKDFDDQSVKTLRETGFAQ